MCVHTHVCVCLCVCVCVCAGMGSVALVLSLLVPDVGNWWYLLTLFAPAAYFYYMQRGERVEEVGTHTHTHTSLIALHFPDTTQSRTVT